MICIDTGEGVEVRIYGSVKQLRRLAVAFAAALDGDVPSAAEVGV